MTEERTSHQDKPVPLGPCCRLLICCEPPQAAAALAEHEQIPLSSAMKIIKGYHLVPKTLEAGPGRTDPDRVALAHHRLERLHERNRNELRAILIDLGHEAEA